MLSGVVAVRVIPAVAYVESTRPRLDFLAALAAQPQRMVIRLGAERDSLDLGVSVARPVDHQDPATRSHDGGGTTAKVKRSCAEVSSSSAEFSRPSDGTRGLHTKAYTRRGTRTTSLSAPTRNSGMSLG